MSDYVYEPANVCTGSLPIWYMRSVASLTNRDRRRITSGSSTLPFTLIVGLSSYSDNARKGVLASDYRVTILANLNILLNLWFSIFPPSFYTSKLVVILLATMVVSKSDPIAIIGGGAFGISTAFELSSRGYTHVTVFEKDEEIPSRWSAANDLNKIMRVEYEDDFYTNLAVVSSSTRQ